MNLTDKRSKEKDLLILTARRIREENRNVSEIKDETSYYLPSSQCMELTPYAFTTIVDLRQALTNLWANDDKMQTFIPIVLAAVFKNRPKLDAEYVPLIEHKDSNDKEVLPVYTYTL